MAAPAANGGASGSHAAIVQTARQLLHLLTKRQQGTDRNSPENREQSQANPSGSSVFQQERPSLQMEMTRSFPGIFTKARGKRRFPAPNLVPAKKPKPLEVVFYLLPKHSERTPKEEDQVLHLQAGLGKRTAHLDESTTHEELSNDLKVLFPKLATISGGWLLYKASGGWGSRKLSLVAPDDTGYTGRILKIASRGDKNLFIAPIQEELSTSPLPLSDDAFRSMPKATCQKCEVEVPLPLLTEHLKSCSVTDVSNNENLINVDTANLKECPVCTNMCPPDVIEAHASTCGESAGNEVMNESTVSEGEQAEVPGPSGTKTTFRDGWLTVSDPSKAISKCAANYLQSHEMMSPLFLSMDVRKNPEEQDMALLSFYKQPNVEWGRPLICRLEGDTAVGQGVTRFFLSMCVEKVKSGFHINFGNSSVTQLFDGEPGHLVPSASLFLVESDMFVVAGRILGHSFLHGGPCLPGLSPTVVHVLLGGSPETATVTLEDCPDLDIRETIRLLENESKLSKKEQASVLDLTLAWDLQPLTVNNRRWLFEKLLIHGVIGRVSRQIKQLRRGLKETPLWTVLTQRPDTVALLFPKEGSLSISPEVLLLHITWPIEDEDEDNDCSAETKSQIMGYLRKFIADATQAELTNLVKFWSGWEIIPQSLSVEVVHG